MTAPYSALYSRALIDPSLAAYDYGTDRAFFLRWTRGPPAPAHLKYAEVVLDTAISGRNPP